MISQTNFFLKGGAATGELFRQFDWDTHPLGNPDAWPENLKSALSISLNSSFPIAIYWGEEFTLLYNDAYKLILGDKHPWALGRKGAEVWNEIWHLVAKEFEDVFSHGESVRSLHAMLPMHRFGYTEECYFDYTLSPIFNTHGKVSGVFNAAVETTYKVINERRNALLYRLSQQEHLYQTREESFENVIRLLGNGTPDIPFGILYAIHPVSGEYILTSCAGIDEAVAREITWPLNDSLNSAQPLVIENANQYIGTVYQNWPEPCTQVCIFPLKQGFFPVSGFFVAGINPGQRIDEDYLRFLDIATRHIATAINAGATNDQVRRINQLVVESENELQFAIDAADLGTWDLDPATNRFAGNDRIKEWFGLQPEDEIELHLATDVIAEEDRGMVLAAIQKAMTFESGGMYDVEYTVVHPRDQSRRVVKAKGQALFNEENIVIRFSGILQDITEQYISRREVERAFEQARLSKEAAQLGTFDLNFIENKLEWDMRCRELFGVSHHLPVTYEKDFFLGLHQDDRARVAAHVTAVMNKEISNGDFDIEYRTVGPTDGRVRWIRAKGRVLFNEKEQAARLIGSVIEITEQKENELRKNDFIGMVSHELKTPLSSLKAYVQLLNARAKISRDDFETNAFHKAEQQINKMTYMINGFLNVARLESGKIQLNKSDFNLRDLILETIAETVLIYKTHLIQLHSCPDVHLYADRDKIGQVINNLVSNAVKYSPHGRTVEVNCSFNDHVARLSIRDDGIGIQQEDLAQLFTRFYRIENDHTKHISGFGIGLYLSAEIIHLHHGKIWAESEMGKGSTFHFSLPASE